MRGASSQGRHPRRTKVKGHRGVYFRIGAGRDRQYEITFLDSDGRRRWQRVEGNLSEAVGALAAVGERKRKGERVAPSAVTFADYFPGWLASRANLRPRTRRLYRWAFDKHLAPAFGRKRLTEITTSDVASWLAGLQSAGYSGHTQRALLTPLSRCLALATRDGLIAGNPTQRLDADERPKLDGVKMRILDRQGIAAVVEAADARYRALIALSLFTGLRQGEALCLVWGDVDLAAGVLRVEAQLGPDGQRVPPKTESAVREVVMMPALVSLLRQHWLATPLPLRRPDGLVFCTAAGSPLDPRNVSQRGLAPALAAAGVEGRFRWHDMRHTAASLMIATGEPVTWVASQLGHANPAITLRVYGKLFDRLAHAEASRARMESAYGSLLDVEATSVSEVVTR
jgi:integrase